MLLTLERRSTIVFSGAAAVVKAWAVDDDLIDEDELLTQEDLARPKPTQPKGSILLSVCKNTAPFGRRVAVAVAYDFPFASTYTPF